MRRRSPPGLIAGKLEEEGLLGEVKLNNVELGGDFRLGPFGFRYIPLAHSIPEGNALLIDTPYGRIFHTGDWKLDDTPQLGDPRTEAELRAIGDEGVLALVCDSTNVFNEESSGSELGVREGLDEVIQDADCRVLVTTFASNAARLKTLGHVAKDTGRQVCVAGRSLDRILRVAKSVGYLTDFPEMIDFETAMKLPPARGHDHRHRRAGGEPRAALARIAFGQHKLALDPGDLVIFSSKQIPGNEIAIGRIQNELAARGIEMITDRQAPVHVSGHPGPARARRDVRLDPPGDDRPGPWRDAPHDGAGALRQGARHPARHRPEEWRPRSGSRPTGPRRSARNGSAG